MKAYKHFKTITAHKLKVMQLCFSLGLYKQGLLHDLSKYMPCEFLTGVKYYSGVISPNTAERNDKGYCFAWLHHKGRNKHHWEFWVDFTSSGPTPAKMPENYVLEMFCDRVAASMIYRGKEYTDSYPYEYYAKRCHGYIMHEETKALIEHLLIYLADNGLEKTIVYIKEKDYLQ